ncbi:MAG: LacI family DNA-binding transcriptional regulator [Clostridia bacterium]
MRATLKTLSEQSGLSKTTISLILNNKEVRVSPEKRKAVLELAEKYDYSPDAIAVGLVSKKTKTVGVLIPDITNPFFAELAKNIERDLFDIGYDMILCNTGDNADEQKKYASLLLGRRIDALLFCLTNDSIHNYSFIEKFKEQKTPVVAFDRYIENSDISFVAVDNLKGVEEAVDYLISAGHKKIGCITGSKSSISASQRLVGYQNALAKAGIEFDSKLVECGDYNFEGGYSACKRILSNDITALFVCNDMMAYGAYKAVDESGKKIPNDISIIGFDDLFFSSMLTVSLSSVKQNTQQMSKKICEIMLNEIIIF